ncbi:MAG TPA: hypothetical protein VKQ29_10825 [Aliidongia sp.]|nr:hypothetical protein [Aliidongia sp.]
MLGQQRAITQRQGYDRENIEAYTVLAEHAQSVGERVALLREAVRIGNRLWAPVLEGSETVDWWRDLGTRPFMRAILAYGQALAEMDMPEHAEQCFKALLVMQPSDSLGAAAELSKPSGPGPR